MAVSGEYFRVHGFAFPDSSVSYFGVHGFAYASILPVPAFTPVSRVKLSHWGSERIEIDWYGSDRTTVTEYGSERLQVLP